MPSLRDIPIGSRATKANKPSYNDLQYDDEIRLLSIPPRREGRSKKLAVKIEHVRLSSLPLYSAVSWTWGSQNRYASLDIDGQKVSVQKSLRKILEQIQEKDQNRKVWIDAICINQEDLDERSQQVQMMGRIYNSANYVLACLTANGAIQVGLESDAKKLHGILRDHGNQSIVKMDDYPFFFGNRYFLRRWIIQEISMAKVVHFCCEGYQFPMGRLSEAMLRISVEENRTSSFKGDQLVAAKRAFQLCQTQTGPRPTSMPLEELLYEHENAQCKEFQDKIYALLSLTTHAKQKLGVDYTIDRERLMLSVLYVSVAFEGLTKFRALSYMIFLHQHLRTDNAKLYDTIIQQRIPEPQFRFTVQGVVRGLVEQLHCDNAIQAAAVEIRKGLPALRMRQPIPMVASHRVADGTPAADTWLMWDNWAPDNTATWSATGVSGADQCLFTFRSYASMEESATNPLTVAFASTPVEVGDQIWQFERTPIAIIARQTPRGYRLVGRALLLRELNPTTQWIPNEIEQQLKWVRSGTRHMHNTPSISLGWREVHEFAMWVNFDS